MRGTRPPWWAYAVAVGVLGYLVLGLYAEVFGPGSTGAVPRFSGGRAVVATVAADYPAGRAGLQPGDVILTALHLPIHMLFDWRAAVENAEVGRPFPIEIDRGGQRRVLALEFEAHWRRWTVGNWLTFVVKAAAQLTTFALAWLVAAGRRRDRVATIGALWLGAVAVTNFTAVTPYDAHAPTMPSGAAAIWRALPAWAGVPIWFGALVFLAGPLLLFAFFAEFPRPVVRTRLTRRLLWLPIFVLALVAEPVLLLGTYRLVYEPQHWVGTMPDWFAPFTGTAVLSMLALALVVLGVNYRRLTDLTERRRLRVLAFGALVGLGATASVAVAGFFPLPPAVDAAVRSPLALAGANVLFLAFPASMSYAVLRQQLFDVRLIVRQGLQYALARGAVVSLVPLCAVVLGIDLVVHGDQPLRDIVLARGWIYAAIAGLALAVHLRRRHWLETLDRRFFRERYDAQQVLLNVVEEIRAAPDLARAAPRVVTRIETALHPQFVSLLVRDVVDGTHRALASAPTGGRRLELPRSSKVTALARLLGKPVDVGPGQSGWVSQQLPEDEVELVRRTGLALIVPVPQPEDGPDAFLALGTKRSEEPYSREDHQLIASVAAGLGLLLDLPAAAASRSSFAECPRCGACHDAGTDVCPTDGVALAAVPLPRLLAERYRLERRVGQGGMGAVYEASDLELGRRVAVKVIREELVASAAAAERFRREARAAAGLAHPNVVTVHDFGVARETRAFLVMELLRGATLRDALEREGRLSPPRAVRLIREVSAAADTAHARGIVHRDLKPENVFLVCDEAGERVKVLDFGLAKLGPEHEDAATATASGVMLGTLHYMGPEQLRGGTVDPGWDRWAIAVMAYEMLTGALPFEAPTALDYQIAVLAGRFTPVARRLTEAPASLQAYFESAFATDPSRRPADLPSFVNGLEAALGS